MLPCPVLADSADKGGPDVFIDGAKSLFTGFIFGEIA